MASLASLASIVAVVASLPFLFLYGQFRPISDRLARRLVIFAMAAHAVSAAAWLIDGENPYMAALPLGSGVLLAGLFLQDRLDRRGKARQRDYLRCLIDVGVPTSRPWQVRK